jgi:hypothetical protein
MLVPEVESNEAEKNRKENRVPISRPKGLVIVVFLFWLAGT